MVWGIMPQGPGKSKQRVRSSPMAAVWRPLLQLTKCLSLLTPEPSRDVSNINARANFAGGSRNVQVVVTPSRLVLNESAETSVMVQKIAFYQYYGRGPVEA